ncbi:MAG: histidinol-phosphatase [Cytophagaceae bacterium]|jgi:histidinol-phosphatase (PHP family)|nr:histidinol-phosphatase [Cytophagaceae bacterium]
MWNNYHGHSCYCDGVGTPEQYVEKAQELGIKTLGISSHAPLPFDTGWTMPSAKLQVYLDDLNGLKAKYDSAGFTLLSSLEVDYIRGIAGPAHPIITAANLNYIVGSVHYVDAFDSGERWSIDSTREEFARGLKTIFGNDINKVLRRYFDYQMEMCDTQPPHILGHCDKIKMHTYFDEHSEKYLSLLYDLLKLTVEKNIVVEINTKYFSRNNLLFPGKEHFRWMHKNNVHVTTNSDAHHPDFLTTGFSETAAMLQAAGYKETWEWDGKSFSPFGIDAN